MTQEEQTPNQEQASSQPPASGPGAPLDTQETPPGPEAAAAGEQSTTAPAERPRPAAPAARGRQTQAGPPIGEREAPKPEAEALAAALKDAWEGIPFEQKFNYGHLELTIPPGDVLEACRRCKLDPRLSFDYLMSLTGTDYESYYEVAYHLYSYRDHRRLTIKTRLDHGQPSVASVTPVWKGADWHEREAAEMLGIDFPGHPNLVPLLLEEGVDEKPLRKSHALVAPYADRPGMIWDPAQPPSTTPWLKESAE